MSIKNLLSKLNDPQMPLLGPNVKALKFVGLLWSEKGNSRNISFFNFALFTILLMILQLIEVWQAKTNVNILLNNLRFSLVSTVTMFKVISMFCSQKQWKEIIQYVTRTDILSRNEVAGSCRKIVTSYTKYCRVFTYVYWAILCCVLVTIISPIPFPLIKYYSSRSFQESVRNGSMQMEHVVVSFWIPFDKHHNVAGFVIVGIYEAGADLYTGGLIAGFDSTIIVLMVFFRGELELLSHLSSRIFDDNDEVVIKRNLIECKRRFNDFHKYANMFKRCISPIMFVYLLVSSFSICACAYQIAVETNLARKLFKVFYILFGVTQLFVYCWHGNNVTYKSLDPMFGVYKSAWWKKPIYRKELIILMMQFDRTILFSAGPTFTLTMDTFSTILKGAYSYFTLFSK